MSCMCRENMKEIMQNNNNKSEIENTFCSYPDHVVTTLRCHQVACPDGATELPERPRAAKAFLIHWS